VCMMDERKLKVLLEIIKKSDYSLRDLEYARDFRTSCNAMFQSLMYLGREENTLSLVLRYKILLRTPLPETLCFCSWRWYGKWEYVYGVAMPCGFSACFKTEKMYTHFLRTNQPILLLHGMNLSPMADDESIQHPSSSLLNRITGC
jgi:hypothetical protein